MRRFILMNEELCMTVEAVAETYNGNIKRGLNTVYIGIHVNKTQGSESWRNYNVEGNNKAKLIAYDSIPPATRSRIDDYYGDVWLCFYAEQFTSKAKDYIEKGDLTWFLDSEINKKGVVFPYGEAEQLAEGCGWMRMLLKRDFFELFGTKGTYYEKAVWALSNRSLYGLKVGNARVLARRVKRFEQEGRASFISKKMGNKNGQKITDLGMDRLLDIYASTLKLSFVQTTKIYNQEAAKNDWSPLSEERVRQLLNMPSSQQRIFASRHGVEASRNKLERTIKRKRPSFPDALWSLDGFTVQLVYQDEKGKPQSGLYCIAVMDVCSDYIAGYKVVEGTETATVVQGALRMACRNTMMLPYQLQYDNSSANKSKEVQELFTRLARVQFPCRPYNGKAKPIENFIGRLEGHVLRHFDSFKGGNITSHNIDRKANPDKLKMMQKDGSLPTIDQAYAQLKLAIKVHNNTKNADGETPEQRYKKAHDQRREMDYFTQVEAFWVERRHQVRYTKDGLTMQVDKKRYTYEVEEKRGIEDLAFRRQYLGDRFTIKYDPDDLEYINLYQNDKWIATAREKWEAPMAVVDMRPGDKEILIEALERRKEDIDWGLDELEVIRGNLEENGLGLVTFETVHKDALNKFEKEELDDILDKTGRTDVLEEQRRARRRRYGLVSDDDADGSVVE